MKRIWATSLAVAGMTLALQAGSQPAMAQEAAFPTKPARMIFGFAPGGSGDLAARLLAEKATAVFGQHVSMENRTGANGMIAAEAIASDVGLGYRIFLVRRYLAMDIILPYVAWISLLAIAADALLRLIARRAGSKALGFVPAPSAAAKLSAEEIVKGLQPEDLFAFGMIPEFVGRLPVISVLEPLDRTALIRILTEPRNAATKQYRKLFALSGMTLEFTPEALEAAADKALALGTGARGLRSVLEGALLETMYTLPTAAAGSRFTVTPAAIRGEQPVTVVAPRKKAS